jgi:flagellar basal-body rod modification protein FlgD
VTIDSMTAASALPTTAGVEKKGKDPLSRDAFLSLLVTQLQHQDPTEPMDNSQFIAQLAQFSSLEQLTQLNTTLSAIATYFEQIKAVATADTNSATNSATTRTEGIN